MCFITNDDLSKVGLALDIFRYQDLEPRLIEVYSFFNEKFESLFKNYAMVYGLSNCFFYIKNDIHCNAFASSYGKYNLLGITNGYPILIEDKFKEAHFSNVVLIALLNDKLTSNAYLDLFEDPNFEFSKFMMYCSIHYTFHHEFRHILQLNCAAVGSNQNISENLDRSRFDLQRHAWEFDADRIAAFEVLKYIFSIYRQQESRNTEKLKCMIYLGLASTIITKNLFYFNVMNQLRVNPKVSKQEFYTENYSHPHPLVRMLNIVEYFFDCVNDDFGELEIKLQDVLNNVFGITKLYFDTLITSSDVMKGYTDEMSEFIEQINEYNQKLYDTAINDSSILTLLNRFDVKVTG